MADGASRSSPVPDSFRFSHSIASGRQLEALNSTGGISVQFAAPGRATPDLAIAGLQSPQFSIWATRSASGFVTRPCFEAGLVTLRFVDRGSMIRRERNVEHVAFGRMAMLVAFDTMLDEKASEHFSGLSATVTRAVLASGHDALTGREDGLLPDFEPVIGADALPIRVVRRTLERIFEHTRLSEQDDLVLSLMEEVLVYQVLSAWPRRPPAVFERAASASPSAIQRALGYIEENLARRIALGDVAASVGIGVRSLQLTFRKELGITPVTYIIERRLKAVHDDLHDPTMQGSSVAEIARRWGFTHLGDFGRRFRLRYGSNPSAIRRDDAPSGGKRPAHP